MYESSYLIPVIDEHDTAPRGNVTQTTATTFHDRSTSSYVHSYAESLGMEFCTSPPGGDVQNIALVRGMLRAQAHHLFHTSPSDSWPELTRADEGNDPRPRYE